MTCSSCTSTVEKELADLPGVSAVSVSLATETAKVVVDALDQQHPARVDGSADLATIMTAAGRMVAGILAGLQKLVRMDTSQALRGQVTYALVRMYERLVAGFDQVSKREALEETTGSSVDQKSASEKARPKPKGGTPRVNIKDIPVLNALAGLLSGIIKRPAKPVGSARRARP